MKAWKFWMFYALLLAVIIVGIMRWHWLIIFPSALLLTIGYIVVKGDTWRQVMGKSDMNGNLVFIGAFISQIVTAAVLYGIGRLIAYLLI